MDMTTRLTERCEGRSLPITIPPTFTPPEELAKQVEQFNGTASAILNDLAAAEKGLAALANRLSEPDIDVAMLRREAGKHHARRLRAVRAWRDSLTAKADLLDKLKDAGFAAHKQAQGTLASVRQQVTEKLTKAGLGPESVRAAGINAPAAEIQFTHRRDASEHVKVAIVTEQQALTDGRHLTRLASGTRRDIAVLAAEATRLVEQLLGPLT